MYITTCLPVFFRNVLTTCIYSKKNGIPGNINVSTHVSHMVGGCLGGSTHAEVFQVDIHIGHVWFSRVQTCARCSSMYC